MNGLHPSLLQKDISAVLRKYPELELIKEQGTPKSLEGIISIYGVSGEKSYGTFHIRVNVPLGYPNEFPSLRELSKLIPRILDRHVYGDGNCCVTVLQRQVIEAKKGISLERYFSQYVIPYLANQLFFEATGSWANGEYEHGYHGLIQFYVETINTENLPVLLTAIEIAKREIEEPKICFCGSERKYKKCHMKVVDELSLLDKERLSYDYFQIEQFMISRLKL
tara:strand:- start:1063 stop:1731 length:669 start_codon:yes stop_codon:yes gene_type:complete